MKIIYSCKYCPQVSTRKWNLKKHVERRHYSMSDRHPLYNIEIFSKDRYSDRNKISDFEQTKRWIRKLDENEFEEIYSYITRIYEKRRKYLYGRDTGW